MKTTKIKKQKQVFHTNEVAHIWAKQSQSEGRNSRKNLFFEGTKIFSYGYHFCIANFMQSNVVLFNSAKYSNTTAKYQGKVWGTIGDSIQKFEVPSVGHSKYSDKIEIDHAVNIEHYKLKINNLLFDARKATKNTRWLLEQANSLKFTAIDYCKAFGLLNTDFYNIDIFAPEFEPILARQEERAKERERNAELKRIEDEREILKDLDKWFLGAGVPQIYTLSKCYLREKIGVIETSKGARVSLKAGKDVKGFDIDGYTVIGLNGVLTIGCHKIERSEINRFAGLQGWGQIEEKH